MGRRDVEAHLVALRHPGREEQDGNRRWLENCLGNLNAPCDLISKRDRVEIKVQQAEANKFYGRQAFFFQPYRTFVLALTKWCSRCASYLGSIVNP